MNQKLVILIILGFIGILIVAFYFWKTNFDRDFNLGIEAYNLNRFSQAEKFFSRVVFLAPFSGKAHGWLGMTLEKQGKDSEAIIEELSKAVSLGHDNFDMRFILGIAFYKLKDVDRAENEFRKALEFNNNADINYWLGNTLVNKKIFSEALGFALKATELNPEGAVYWASLGLIYKELGRHEEGLQALDRSISLDPQNCSPYNRKANIFLELKRYSEALNAQAPAFKLAEAQEGSSNRGCLAQTYLTRATVFEAQKDINSAISDYKKVLEISPEGTATSVNFFQKIANQRLRVLEGN